MTRTFRVQRPAPPPADFTENDVRNLWLNRRSLRVSIAKLQERLAAVEADLADPQFAELLEEFENNIGAAK